MCPPCAMGTPVALLPVYWQTSLTPFVAQTKPVVAVAQSVDPVALAQDAPRRLFTRIRVNRLMGTRGDAPYCSRCR